MYIRLLILGLLIHSCSFVIEADAQATRLTDHAPFLHAVEQVAVSSSVEAAYQDEVISYHGDPAFYFNLEQDIPAVILRLTAPMNGVLTGINFPLFVGETDAVGIQGPGMLQVKFFREADFPNFFPSITADPVGMVEVPFEDLQATQGQANFNNPINLSTLNLTLEEGEDYLIQLSIDGSSSGAVLTTLTDEGSTDENDPAFFPARTAIYVRGSMVPTGGVPGYYLFTDNANLLINFIVSPGAPPTAAETAEVPRFFSLHAAYPNPFNPTTTVSFDLEQPAVVELTVYDHLGRVVETLVDGPHLAGPHHVTWQATNVPSGTYFYRLNAHGQTQVRAVSLMK